MYIMCRHNFENNMSQNNCKITGSDIYEHTYLIVEKLNIDKNNSK